MGDPKLRMPSKYLAYVPSPPPFVLIYKTPSAPSLQQRREEGGSTAPAPHTPFDTKGFTGSSCAMGLLDQLWDDTVAGPRPDHGLGRLRKYASFSPSSAAAGTTAAPPADVAAPAVTRSITILRPPALSVTSPRSESSSAPSSPASVPDSPFGAATTPRGEGWSKLRRKGRMAADGADASPGTPRSPTVYDWVVISSLDR